MVPGNFNYKKVHFFFTLHNVTLRRLKPVTLFRNILDNTFD